MSKNLSLNIVTRFAPSPTGYLHIGGARTALFNWMYSKKYSGKFLLRIEDTDQKRSNEQAEAAILDGLRWLGLDWDDEVVYQTDRMQKHLEIANYLLRKGSAYKCYATKIEIDEFKRDARKKGTSTKFISPWRNKESTDVSIGDFVLRLKSPNSGQTIIQDGVQGKISWNNKDLDDLILVRSDGTPTYNLAVVVDDFDSHVTHIIRGDDHLTNAARQKSIYDALNWNVPHFAHIPLIHGSDGKKLSKRHDAISLESYQKEGVPSAAMNRYLTQLGWDSGSNDLHSIEQLSQRFKIDQIVKSPAKFDRAKLNDICGKLIRNATDTTIMREFDSFIKFCGFQSLSQKEKTILSASLYFLKPRVKNYQELYEQAYFLMKNEEIKIDKACYKLINKETLSLLEDLGDRFSSATWEREEIDHIIKLLIKEYQIEFKMIAQMIRIAIAGKLNSPGIIDMIMVLGKTKVLRRFKNLCKKKYETY